jgi:hypothetical protein
MISYDMAWTSYDIPSPAYLRGLMRIVARAHTGEKKAKSAVYSMTLNPRSFISFGCRGQCSSCVEGVSHSRYMCCINKGCRRCVTADVD